MGVSLFSDSEAFNLVENADGFELPFDSTGLEYLQFHNSTNPTRNLAEGKSDANFVGNVIGNNYSLTLLGRTNYIDTGIKQVANNYTLFHVFHNPATAAEIVGISNYRGTADLGLSLQFRNISGTSRLACIAGFTNNGGTSQSPVDSTMSATLDKDYASCYRITLKQLKLDMLTENRQSVQAPNAGFELIKGAGNILIGSSAIGSMTTGTQHFMSAIFSRILTDDEVQQLYGIAKSYLTPYGRVV